jgi:quinol-cytochrome oxidoreductase complex cytochrome b subunit
MSSFLNYKVIFMVQQLSEKLQVRRIVYTTGSIFIVSLNIPAVTDVFLNRQYTSVRNLYCTFLFYGQLYRPGNEISGGFKLPVN